MGIEKITDKIARDAIDYEKSTTKEAQKEIDGITEGYKARAESIKSEILDKGGKNAAALISRAESGAALIKRNQLILMKANMIDEVFKSVEERIASMPEGELLELFINILDSASEPGKGEVIFNKRDRQKFGDKFIVAANKKISETKKESEFVLSNGTADIKNGFILKYGDIETNCSLEKIIDSRKSHLEPQVIKILFNGKDAAAAKKSK